MEALARVAQCHLSLPEPVLITVADTLPDSIEGCVGYFECATNRIFLRTPDAIAGSRDPLSAFPILDPKVQFDSLVVHELAHAAFQQTGCTAAICPENHEYVGYAMQMWALPDQARTAIVDRFRKHEPIDARRLNMFIAAIAPDRYAAYVW
jgi:hypothetical protein